MRDTQTPLPEIITSLQRTLAFSPRDWGSSRADAWTYGIICGWGHAIKEVAAKHGWDAEEVARLQRYHEALTRTRPQREALRAELNKSGPHCEACGYLTVLCECPKGEAAPTKSQAKRIALQREAPIMPPTCKECGLIICKCPTSEGAASEVEERHGYEIFFDRGYYELWAVRKKGVTSLEQTLHAPTRQEAINIAFALSQAEQRARQAGREEAIRECAEIAGDVVQTYQERAAEAEIKDEIERSDRMWERSHGAAKVKRRILSKLSPTPTNNSPEGQKEQ
jgi:hypothetical protein